MARKPTKLPDIETPFELVVSRKDAEEKIQDRIEKGRELLTKEIRSWEALESVKKEYYKWSDYNEELLKIIFTNDSLSKKYRSYCGVVGFGGQPSLGDEIRDLHNDINEKIHRLESIKERLELIPTASGVTSAPTAVSQKTMTNKAFIVHGHDEGARESVARFLERLGIIPVILHE